MQTPDSHKPSFWPVLLGGIALVLVFAFAVKILMASTPALPEEDAARAVERAKARVDLEAENKMKLETYAWTDKAKGAVQIPITQAMELTVAAAQGRQPQPAGPVATPVPVAAPEPPSSPVTP
ncbi:MAG: hypothetical protein WCQ57_07280 [Verrucomicrobiota bacterium]